MYIYQPICLPPIPNLLGGESDYFQSSVGKIYYTVAGQGQPLLLVHGINAGASNYAWEKNFCLLARYYRVYAIDLPGFGRSEKRPTKYVAEIYQKGIMEFVQNQIGEPVSVISGGLSAAYLLALANEEPDWFKKLVLITPSGVIGNSGAPCEASFTTYNLFTTPVQGDAVYNAFVSPASIDYFLRNFIYANPKQVTPFIVHYTYQAAHQCPYAQYAPASFVAGFSNINVAPIVGDIQQPVLILWGAKAKLSPVENIRAFTELNPSFDTYIFMQSGLIPQREQPCEFNRVVLDFLGN